MVDRVRGGCRGIRFSTRRALNRRAESLSKMPARIGSFRQTPAVRAAGETQSRLGPADGLHKSTRAQTNSRAPKATQKPTPNRLDLPKIGRWGSVPSHAKESLATARFATPDPSESDLISGIGGAGTRESKLVTKPGRRSPSRTEHGRGKSPRAAKQATAQWQSHSIAGSLGVVGTAMSSTTFDLER
jgi:hypothetical protein